MLCLLEPKSVEKGEGREPDPPPPYASPNGKAKATAPSVDEVDNKAFTNDNGKVVKAESKAETDSDDDPNGSPKSIGAYGPRSLTGGTRV